MIHGLILKAGWEILHTFAHGVTTWVHAIAPDGQHIYCQLENICDHGEVDDRSNIGSDGE